MSFDFSKSIVVANVYGSMPPDTTRAWLAKHFSERHVKGYSKPVLICARNSMIRDVALPAMEEERLDWVFFIDNDVTITEPGVWNFLEIDADVVSCECRMREPGCWHTDDAFHNPFWRCRPEVLQSIEPPWFTWNLSADGCDTLGCDCLSFRDRARDAGFTIRHGGWCSHANQGTWCTA